MTTPSEQSIRDLLLRESMPPVEVAAIWQALGHPDWEEADHALQRMAAELPARLALAEVLPQLLTAMQASADPPRALLNFERLLTNLAGSINFLRYLPEDPRALELLVTLFAGSQFLSNVLIRNPEYQELLTAGRAELLPTLDHPPADRLGTTLAALSSLEARLDATRRFQRLELLRIGTADLVGLIQVREVVRRLSALADALVQHCLSLALESAGVAPDFPLLVCALGKLGGSELNYSSDIDLLLVRADDCEERVATRVGSTLIRFLSEATPEGYLYRVDMRLRPWGSVGPLVPSVSSFLRYLKVQSRLWEQQACLKLRPVAGAETAREHLLEALPRLLFRDRPPRAAREDIRRMKELIEAELRKRGDGENVKLGVGGIRDIEFTVQCLQLEHGGRVPHVRDRSTLGGLRRLAANELLTDRDAHDLRVAYEFLRTVEHRLQMMESAQVHTLPNDGEELRKLALRLGFGDTGAPAEETFRQEYDRHTTRVRQVFERQFTLDG